MVGTAGRALARRYPSRWETARGAGIARAALAGGLILVVSMRPVVASGQSRAATPDPGQLVREANKSYASGDYAKAMELYGSADVVMPESAELAYNRGVTLYKLGDYEAARAVLNKALSTRNASLESKAKFNLGNVAYASAMEKMSAPQEAIDQLKQAIGHYRDALEVNPGDEDAPVNIQAAQLMIKDLLDKVKQQQEQQQNQQQSQQGDQNQTQSDQQQGESQPDQGDTAQEQNQDGQQQGRESQPEPPQDGTQDPGGDEQGDIGEAPAETAGMTNQEAERLLQSVRDREKERRDAQAQRMRARRVPVSKDW